jgi:hypothetical protein
MLKFIFYFLWFIAFYHILNTFFVWKLGISRFYVSISKDVIWFSFIFILILLNFKRFFLFLKKYLSLILILILLTIWSFWISLHNWINFYQILVGFKYDLLPLYILVSSIFVWYLLKWEIEKYKLIYVIYKFVYLFLILNLVVGVLKIVFPKLFFYLWYWPLRDFIPTSNPPVYYTSWVWGLPRLSGFFGWPNELWFFFVFILPFLWYIWKKINTIKKFLKIKKLPYFFDKIFWFWLFQGVLTLSRWFILWFFVESILVFYKKIIRHVFLSFIAILIALIWVFILNKTRPLSTNDHIILTKIWIERIKKNPLWYGLGISWPSAFYTVWNDNLYEIKKFVPENTYLQIGIDLWVVGLILFLIFWFVFSMYYLKSWSKWLLRNIKIMLFFGFLWFIIEGFFLHIFWDSMVVYLVLTILWFFTE